MGELVMPFSLAGNDELRGCDGARGASGNGSNVTWPVYANLRATAGRSGDMGHADTGFTEGESYRLTWYASFTKNPSLVRERRDQLNSSSVSSELP